MMMGFPQYSIIYIQVTDDKAFKKLNYPCRSSRVYLKVLLLIVLTFYICPFCVLVFLQYKSVSTCAFFTVVDAPKNLIFAIEISIKNFIVY